jgi:hypothetical protein
MELTLAAGQDVARDRIGLRLLGFHRPDELVENLAESLAGGSSGWSADLEGIREDWRGFVRSGEPREKAREWGADGRHGGHGGSH